MRWRRGVVAKLHAELALALRGCAQLRAEAKHGVQATVAGQCKILAPNICVMNCRTALVHQHEDTALKLVRCCNGCFHERLQDLASSIAERPSSAVTTQNYLDFF